MPLHEQSAAVLRELDAWNLPAPADMTWLEIRALEARCLEAFAGPPEAVAEVRDLEIPTGSGAIGARAFRSVEGPANGVLVWLHGGGWVTGTVEGAAGVASALANASGCVVLSVGYRLAPEHRYPAAAEDALAAVRWAAGNPGVLGAEAGRLAVGGDSAGGNLAAVAALMARDRGGPRIDFQLLVYPVTCRELDAQSRREYGEGHWLTMEAMEWCWSQYVGADAASARSAYASPLLAESLAGLPPAFVVLAECDLLHDEGVQYAERLARDGVPVERRCHAGMLHGFIQWDRVIDAAHEALREAGAAVAAGLATPGC